MRIIHMIGYLRLGAGRYIANLALEQARRDGNRVLLFTSPDAEGNWKSDPRLLQELAHGGVIIDSLGDFFHREPKSLFEAASRIRTITSGWSPDTVFHAHSAMAAAAAHWSGDGAVVCTCHGWNLARLREYELEDALAYQLCNAVTSPSQFWADWLKSEMRVAEVSVVPVGLNLRRFPPPPAYADTPGTVRIVSVGELTIRKGFDVLLDAMPLVWERKPEVELHIMGEGDLASQLRRKAASFGPAQARVRFHGFVRAPYAELPRYSLFCLASRSDNLPVAIIEAMLARLPIVATNIGGIPELVRDGGCGFLVPPDSPIALAEQLVRMIELGAEQRAHIGMRGEHFARERFAIERIVDEFALVYRKALQNQVRR